MRNYANKLAPYRIRVNTVHPTGVNTPMVVNEIVRLPGQDPSLSGHGQRAPRRDGRAGRHLQCGLWLVSDEARYVTGVTLPVDAGFTNKK